MLWLALHCRHLPLEVFTRGMPPDAQPIAITSGAETGDTVVAVNRLAQARGVSPGMNVSAACALAAGLHTLARDTAKEHATLKRIAAWSLQFTSLVSIADSGEILLEIEGSLKLFGGLTKLHQHIARGIAELGFNANIACAPTPLAALWFARAGVNVRVQHQDALRHALEKLPADLICDHPTTRDLLDSFGARTLGDCLQLPRDGLARRAGQRLLDQLDRALGTRADPRLPYVAPQTYNAALPLPAPVANADALLFAARRLLTELCGWLSATGHGVQRPRFEFIHEKQLVTVITLELASASRDLDHLTTLLRERLGRTELPCAAIEIAIVSGRVTPLASRNLAFLPDSAGHEESASRFVERLNARLGAHTICGLTPHADYRPERAWRACQPGAGANVNENKNAGSALMPSRPLTRPLWLLTTPRPLRETGETNAAPHDHEGGPLSLLAGPERIEAGWWDGQHVARDYFVARNQAQSLLWIYRERSAAARWYVHGFFS
jgi:protein ImuB